MVEEGSNLSEPFVYLKRAATRLFCGEEYANEVAIGDFCVIENFSTALQILEPIQIYLNSYKVIYKSLMLHRLILARYLQTTIKFPEVAFPSIEGGEDAHYSLPIYL